MNLNVATAQSLPSVMPGMRMPLPVQDVTLRHLKTPREIEQVLHLREEIDLSVHLAAGGDFLAREKKETSAAWCSPSNTKVN